MDITKLLQKSIHAGSIYTLPEDVKLNEQQIKSWLAAFLALFKDDEQVHITQTWWLWREDDENEIRARNGVPADVEQIQWLFKSKRLSAAMFQPKLITAELNILRSFTSISRQTRGKENGVMKPCDTCTSQTCTTETCEAVLKLYDRIARSMTGGQYQTIEKLFEGAESIRRTITKLRTQMGNLLHPDLIFQFEDADFTNWKELSNGIRRVYDVDQTENTMISVFHSLNEIISSNKRAEVKVAAFKNLISRIAIKSEDDFIDAQDMKGKDVFMNHPEEYNPLINTLFTFMLFRDIPESKWPSIQEDFERKIQSGWSYRIWHENRPKLYELIDKASKSKRAVNQVAQIDQTTDGPEYEHSVDICKIQGRFQNRDFRPKSAPSSRSNSRARENQNARNRFASQERFNGMRDSKSLNERKEANEMAEKTKANLCIHCTTHNDRQIAIYHPPGTGFGGTGSCCIYNTSGDINGQKARGMIQEILDSNETRFMADQNVFSINNEHSAFDEEDNERENL